MGSHEYSVEPGGRILEQVLVKAVEFALETSNKIGLLVMDEELLPELSERLRLRCDESSIPLVLPLPLGSGQDPANQTEIVQEMVRSAIGFTVKLD